jgi:hypothetical protein
MKERLDKKHIDDKDVQAAMLRTEHAAGHFGSEQLFKAIWRKGFYWPALLQQCKSVVGNCKSCLEYNVGREGFNPIQSLNASNSWDHVAVDLAVDLPETERGNKHILIVVDVTTRYLVAVPLKCKDMNHVAGALYDIILLFGPPRALQSDNGKEFVNELLKQLLHISGTDKRLVAPYNPRANGLAERFVQMVKQCLKKRLDGRFGNWDDQLRGVIFDINTKESRILKSSPFALFFGRAAGDFNVKKLLSLLPSLILPSPDTNRSKNDIMTQVIRPAVNKAVAVKLAKRNKQINIKRKIMSPIKAGTRVWLKNVSKESGLEPIWIGPYYVNKMHDRGTYELKDGLTKQILQRPVPISKLQMLIRMLH